MATLRRFLLRLLTAIRPDRAEDDLAREVASHLALLEEQFRHAGMAPKDARLAALRAFGGVEQAKEHQRDARAFRWLDDARRDAVYALRSLARTPSFATTAIATLALGIATTTAVYSLFDAVLLRPLPVDRPGELRVVEQVMEVMSGRVGKASTGVPYTWFVELRPNPEVFSSVMAIAESREAMATVNGRESRLIGGGLFVSDNFFELLGLVPAAGRLFAAGDDGAAHQLIVLSHSYWRREFAASTSAVGSTMLFNGVPFTIAGVAPASFAGLEMGSIPDVYLPIETLSLAQPGVAALAGAARWTVQVIGRVRPDISDHAAGQRLTTTRNFMKRPPEGARHHLRLLPLEQGLSDVRERFARPLSIMLGMGLLLLLVACANVATLLGARAAFRRNEIVIRTAIGAGKNRLVRQLLIESLVLATIAGLLAIVTASWSTRLLLAFLPQDANPLQLSVTMDRRVLAFAIAVTMITALVAGLIPALRSLGFDIASALRDRSRGGTGAAAHGRPFAIAQVAISLVLVVASAMFTRTLYNLTVVDLGFDPNHLIQVFVAPGERQYTGPALDRFYRDAYARLGEMSGVRSVTWAQMSMLDTATTTGTVTASGFDARSEEEREAQMFQIGPAFFQTTGMTVIAGRDFTEDDVFGVRRVAAVNDIAARRFFGDRNPIGQTIESGGRYEIIAIVRSAKYNTLRDSGRLAVFVPYTTTRARPRLTFMVRTTGADDAVMRTAAAAVRGADTLIPTDVSPTAAFVNRSMAQEQLLTGLSVAFAASALLLLSIGLYGIMTFWVTERTAEIGIHLALGASLSRVRWTVIRQPLWLGTLGIAIGLPISILGARVVDALMFGVSVGDPVTIGVSVTLILIVTMTACLAPARRATRVDPMVALRCE